MVMAEQIDLSVGHDSASFATIFSVRLELAQRVAVVGKDRHLAGAVGVVVLEVGAADH